MIRSIVLLPQPDGPTNTAASPAPSAKATPATTSCRSPAALLNVLPVISTSSRTGAPPGCPGLKWLHQQGFNEEHDRREAERVGKQ